jgi:uncharacterized protein (UPF0262 family)
LLADTLNQCFAHAANLCEAYYDAVRRSGTATADRMISDFGRQGVRFRSDMDIPFWKEAAQLKGVCDIEVTTCRNRGESIKV